MTLVEVKRCIDSQSNRRIEADSCAEDDESYDEDGDGNIVIHESEIGHCKP